MSDEQQRAFMLQASMKKLSAATALPRRAPSSRVKEAVSERVFASEKGFLKNSAVSSSAAAAAVVVCFLSLLTSHEYR